MSITCIICFWWVWFWVCSLALSLRACPGDAGDAADAGDAGDVAGLPSLETLDKCSFSLQKTGKNDAF